MSSLLDGIRVVESASLLNGDRLGAILGDLGADVVKVEHPSRGDYLRDFIGQITPHHSPAHVQVNKQKRSLTLDLGRDLGREVFWKLLATADVFVDGHMPGAAAKLGISYDEQRARRPEIVYCQCTGYGSTGPYSAVPPHGQMMTALAGGLPVVTDEDGWVRPGDQRSSLHPLGAGDGTAVAAVHAAAYVCAALVHRDRTGRGSFIDVAGADAVVANGWLTITNRLNADRITDRSTMPVTGGGDGAKYQFYETKDGRYVVFCAIEHRYWDAFCVGVGREDLRERKDTRAPVDFAPGETGLRRELQSIFLERTLEEWMGFARERSLPIGPIVNQVDELRGEPHLESRGLFVEGSHPHAGPFTYLRESGVVADDAYVVRHPAPLLGEHTDEILAELGYEHDSVEELRSLDVV